MWWKERGERHSFDFKSANQFKTRPILGTEFLTPWSVLLTSSSLHGAKKNVRNNFTGWGLKTEGEEREK